MTHFCQTQSDHRHLYHARWDCNMHHQYFLSHLHTCDLLYLSSARMYCTDCCVAWTPLPVFSFLLPPAPSFWPWVSAYLRTTQLY